MSKREMGTWEFYTPGLNNVGSYQVSGYPFLTGSDLETNQQIEIKFPSVTKSITVMQTGSNGSIRIHFDNTSSAPHVLTHNNFWPLDSKEDVFTMGVKAAYIYISNASTNHTGFKLFAELTNIATSSLTGRLALSGSGINNL